MKKSKINFSGILVEAVLIFLSVYGAFLLEDKRTRDNNTKILIGKLNQLKEEIIRDSLRFSDMIQPIGKSQFSINIPSIIQTDSLVIQHLEEKSSNRFEMIAAYENVWLFIGSQWIDESPTYDFLMRNYLQNIKLEDSEIYLEAYFRTRRAIVTHNRSYLQNHERMVEYFDERIPYQNPEKTKVRRINAPIWQNTLAKNYTIIKEMRELIETLLIKARDTIRQLELEIEAQRD